MFQEPISPLIRTFWIIGSLLYLTGSVAALLSVFIPFSGPVKPVEVQTLGLAHVIVGLLLVRRST